MYPLGKVSLTEKYFKFKKMFTPERIIPTIEIPVASEVNMGR